MGAFGLYHKALALASVGDFEGADEILSGRRGNCAARRGIIAHVADPVASSSATLTRWT